MSDFAGKISTADREATSRATARNMRRQSHNPVRPLVGENFFSSGSQLDTTTRQKMENRLGHNFADVRVHDDARAAKSAARLGANAYTFGRDIVFARGKYSPRTTAGSELLAHELTHVVQQRNARLTNGVKRQSGSALEEEAIANARSGGPREICSAPASPMIQCQANSSPKGEGKPGAKSAVSQPPPTTIPVAEVHKQATAAPAGKKNEGGEGPQVTATQSTETEITHDKSGFTAKPEDKFELELTIPITDRLHLGRLSFAKEASISGSLGFPSAQPYPKTLSSLEAQASLKVLSLEYEKVKVPLGTADFEISASALASSGYDLLEHKNEFKAGFAAEAEAKYHPGKKSPFFITATAGVEKTYDKEGNARFDWGPVTWKTSVGVGVEF